MVLLISATPWHPLVAKGSGKRALPPPPLTIPCRAELAGHQCSGDTRTRGSWTHASFGCYLVCIGGPSPASWPTLPHTYGPSHPFHWRPSPHGSVWSTSLKPPALQSLLLLFTEHHCHCANTRNQRCRAGRFPSAQCSVRTATLGGLQLGAASTPDKSTCHVGRATLSTAALPSRGCSGMRPLSKRLFLPPRPNRLKLLSYMWR